MYPVFANTPRIKRRKHRVGPWEHVKISTPLYVYIYIVLVGIAGMRANGFHTPWAKVEGGIMQDCKGSGRPCS